MLGPADLDQLVNKMSPSHTNSNTASPNTDDQPTKTFTKFPELPVEIQLQIWHHAVPDAHSILGVIRLILDFDIGNQRAIIPSVREYKEAHPIMFHVNAREDYGEDVTGIFKDDDTRISLSHAPIFALLGTSQMARSITLKRYRLAIASNIEVENKPWWNPEEDVVIFTVSDEEHLMLVHWLFRKREEPLAVLESLQHLAIQAVRGISRRILPDQLGVWNMRSGWLLNIPNLQSFTVLVDPMGFLDRKTGRILLHEPKQTRVDILGWWTPEDFVGLLTSGLAEDLGLGGDSDFDEDDEDDDDPRDNLPLVEIFVTGWRKC